MLNCSVSFSFIPNFFYAFLCFPVVAVPALPGSLVPWTVGIWRYWREKAQLLHHLVLLLVSLCQLLKRTVPVPQQDTQPSP